MKIVCKNNIHPANSSLDLTIGKTYETIDYTNDHGWFKIINDNGLLSNYSKFLFKTIDEIREEKLNTILQ